MSEEDPIDRHDRIQSHVKDRWFVSTIMRDSSAMDGGRYYETLVWRWDFDSKERGEMVGWMGSGLKSHFEACRKLMNGGEELLKEEDDT